MFDEKVPSGLKQLQQWFASVITLPLGPENSISEIGPLGHEPMCVEAARYVTASPQLAAYKRLEIYNQQYWWRLLSALRDAFPTLVRLFGYDSFNQVIAIPFLTQHVPDHWALYAIGQKLPQWLQENYHTASDRPLVLACAELDQAFNQAFVAAHHPLAIAAEGLDITGVQALMQQPLALQRHVSLFWWPWDLLAWRKIFLEKEVEHWIDNEFPPLKKEGPYYVVLYRTGKNNIVAESISCEHHYFLSLFKEQRSLEQICQAAEKGCDEASYMHICQNLASWIKLWLARQWLVVDSIH